MLRLRQPAEFLEHVTLCNDCGIALVTKDALGTSETEQAVASFHQANRRAREAQTESAAEAEADVAPARLDITTGVALLVLSLGLLVGSFAVSSTVGRGGFFIAIGPFLYGLTRLSRGLDARRAEKADP